MGLSLPGWPGGDPDRLRTAASTWDALAAELQAAAQTADATVQECLAELEGVTKDNFLEVWNHYVEGQRQAGEGARTVAEGLRSTADKIDEAHRKYEHIMEGLGAAAAVGIVVGFFTFGLGTAVEETAAFGVATAAITSLLETLGLTLGEELVGDVLAQVVIQSVVGTEFSVFMQEGASIGAGDGLRGLDWTTVATSAATGGVLGGVMKGVEAAALVKAALAGTVMGGGMIAGSELDGHGMPSATALLVGTLLSGLGGRMDASVDGALERLAAQAEEKNLAIDFAALYKQDPESLLALKNDPYQSDEIRYLAYQYHELFESDPRILDEVPALDDLLKNYPYAVAEAVKVNTELMQVAKLQGLPPSVVRGIWESLAPQAATLGLSYDGVSDYVKDWMEQHHEVVEELEKQLKPAAR